MSESRPVSGRVVAASDALFRPVRAGSAFEEAVERLLQAIKLGVVVRGDRLPSERELAGRLGLSRATLREAIRTLQELGFVESRLGRYGGAFVVYPPRRGARASPRRRPIPRAAIEDALVFREAVEIGAAVAAARTGLSAREASYLRQRLADVERAPLARYRQADSRLHLAVAELAGSTSLLAAVADARLRVNDLLDAIPLLPPNLVHANRQHAALVDAVVGGDADRARRVLEAHLHGTAALLRGFLG